MHPIVKFLLFLMTAGVLAFVGFWGMVMIVFTGHPEVAVPCLVIFLLALLLCLFTRYKKQTGIVMLLSAVIGGGHYGYHMWQYEQARKVPQMTAGNINLRMYEPFSRNNQLARLDAPSTLQIPAGERPRLDGAVALYPLYAAFVQAVYPPPGAGDTREYDHWSSDFVRMTNTPQAYERLIAGETDMIFVAAPSDEQVKAAKAAGKTFKLTPIGKEAFVFFVNGQNPVSNLTTGQVVDIYSGRLKNWREVGGPDQAIRAFQRNENSGSQSTMQKIMGNTPLMTPLREDRLGSMGGIVNDVADYRNYSNALGYSFLYYTQTMLKNNQIKLLNINGIAPTRDNIINGTYPYAKAFYVVTTGNESPAVQQFIAWIKSPQGKTLINRTGYVAIEE